MQRRPANRPSGPHKERPMLAGLARLSFWPDKHTHKQTLADTKLRVLFRNWSATLWCPRDRKNVCWPVMARDRKCVHFRPRLLPGRSAAWQMAGASLLDGRLLPDLFVFFAAMKKAGCACTWRLLPTSGFRLPVWARHFRRPPAQVANKAAAVPINHG